MPRIKFIDPPTAGAVAAKIQQALTAARILRTSVPHGSEADQVLLGRISAYRELLHWLRTGEARRSKS